MTIYGSFVASDLRHYACAQNTQMPIKSKIERRYICHFQQLSLLVRTRSRRLSLFVVYAVFVLEMSNQVGLFVVFVRLDFLVEFSKVSAEKC